MSADNLNAQELVQVSEERFRTMFAEHAAVMLLIDPDTGAILNANHAASVFYGYSIATLCTMNIDAINVKSHAEIAEILRQVQTGRQKVFVFEHRRADGQARTVEVHSSPIRLDHKPVLFSIIHDITERKRAEEDLRASELKYRVVADNTFDWEFWQAPDGTFLYSSPSCARVTGHTADEFIRNPHLLFEIIHPDDVAAFKRHKTHVTIRQVPETIRFRVVTPDASVRWVEHACQPVFDESGQYRGTRGSNRDVTEHHQLASRVEDLAALVELADVAIIACTFQDVITYWNHGAEGLYGWHRHAALGQNIHTLLHTVFPRSPQAIRQALLDEDYWSGELTHTRANQQPVIVSSRQTLRHAPDGKPLSILQINVDITARKQAEEALRASQARANALLAAVPDMMFRMNRAGVFLDYKAERRDLYAQSERTLVGKSIREVSPPAFAELIENEIRATLATTAVRTFEYQLPIPERGVRSYEARIVASGPDEVTAIVRDITDRR